jgi:hypothetical protein
MSRSRNFDKYCKYPKGEEKTKNIMLYGFISIIVLITITVTLLAIYGVNWYTFAIPFGILLGIVLYMSLSAKVKCDEGKMGKELGEYLDKELKELQGKSIVDKSTQKDIQQAKKQGSKNGRKT